MEGTSTKLREKGNELYRKFHDAISKNQKKDILLEAIELYKMSLDVAQKQSELNWSDQRMSSKNLALSFKHLALLETQTSKRKQYFHDSVQYFTHSFICYSKETSIPNNTEWCTKTFIMFKGLGDAYFDFIDSIWPINDRFRHIQKTFNYFEEFKHLVPVLNNACIYFYYLHANWLFNQAAEKIGSRQYKEGKCLLAEMYTPLEKAKCHIKDLQDEYLSTEIRILFHDYETYSCLAEALQSFYTGLDLLKEAIEGDENIQMIMVWDALDKLREATILARGQSIEFECMANAKIGYIYNKVLKRKVASRKILKDVMNNAQVLERNLYEMDWYAEVAEQLKEFQDDQTKQEEALWENLRSPFIDNVKNDLKEIEKFSSQNDHVKLITMLFDKYPPKHLTDYVKLKPDLTDANPQWKKIYFKLVCHYHTDKVDVAVHGVKYKVLCEEICKILTNKYEYFKQ